MRFVPTYEVHVADPLGFEQSPFIITTVYTDLEGYPMGEWFLGVLADDDKLFAQRVRLPHTHFPDRLGQFRSVLLRELLARAQLRLRRYIVESQGDAIAILTNGMDTRASDENLLVTFRLRGMFAGCLGSIGQKTQCKPLADFIEWVLELPTLDSEDL
jgi:hypothetical protein